MANAKCPGVKKTDSTNGRAADDPAASAVPWSWPWVMNGWASTAVASASWRPCEARALPGQCQCRL